MFRKRLLCVGLLMSMLPGCACWGERPGLLTRFRNWRDGGETRSDDCNCQATPVVYGGPIGMSGGSSGPIILPGNPGSTGGIILPMPGTAESDPPKIPKAGIKESPGKMGELESRTPGPVIGLPVGGK
jgi:hypothetical protein